MRITGTAVLHASADQVWTALNDPNVLVGTIPGCKQLEAIAPDRYRMTIFAGVASIKGTYTGEVELSEPLPPDSFTLRASGSGAPGTVSAEVRMSLTSPDAGTTTVSYEADAVIGGAVGGVGQRVITAVAKRTAGQFFAAVESALAGAALEDNAPTASTAGPATGTAGAARLSGQPAGPTSSAPTVFTRPVNPPRPGRAFSSTSQGAMVGAAIALVGVLIGWRLGRRSRF